MMLLSVIQIKNTIDQLRKLKIMFIEVELVKCAVK